MSFCPHEKNQFVIIVQPDATSGKYLKSDEGGERRVTSVESRVDRVGRCDVRD